MSTEKPKAVAVVGNADIFDVWEARSFIREDVVHLCHQPPPVVGMALCGASVQYGWARVPDLHPEKLFNVCAPCHNEAKRLLESVQ